MKVEKEVEERKELPSLSETLKSMKYNILNIKVIKTIKLNAPRQHGGILEDLTRRVR